MILEIQDPDNLTYQFPVEAGTTVEVRLFFAEIFSGITAPGQRVMDVEVEGVVDPELNDIDAFAVAGLNGAFMRTVEVVVSEDGLLDIEAISELATQRAALKAIEVVKIADPVDDTAPTAVITPVSTLEDTDADIIVEVTYEDDTLLDEGSIDVNDLALTGPGLAVPLAASDVSVAAGVATYTFEAPEGGWDEGDFTATLAADAVIDGSGNVSQKRRRRSRSTCPRQTSQCRSQRTQRQLPKQKVRKPTFTVIFLRRFLSEASRSRSPIQ